MINTNIKNIIREYDLKRVDVSRETITTIEGFKYELVKIGFDNLEFDNLKDFEEYVKDWKLRGEIKMEKVIKIRELKRDIKEGCYELIDHLEVERNLFLTMLMENDTILVYFEDYNNMTKGGIKVDKMEILSKKKEDLIKLLDSIYYYNVCEDMDI